MAASGLHSKCRMKGLHRGRCPGAAWLACSIPVGSQIGALSSSLRKAPRATGRHLMAACRPAQHSRTSSRHGRRSTNRHSTCSSRRHRGHRRCRRRRSITSTTGKPPKAQASARAPTAVPRTRAWQCRRQRPHRQAPHAAHRCRTILRRPQMNRRRRRHHRLISPVAPRQHLRRRQATQRHLLGRLQAAVSKKSPPAASPCPPRCRPGWHRRRRSVPRPRQQQRQPLECPVTAHQHQHQCLTPQRRRPGVLHAAVRRRRSPPCRLLRPALARRNSGASHQHWVLVN